MTTDKKRVTTMAKNQGEAEMSPVTKAPKPGRFAIEDCICQSRFKRSVKEIICFSDKLFGVRHFQVCLLFVGILLAYTLRVNLSVAIVAMLDKENANPDYPVSFIYMCQFRPFTILKRI